MPDAKLETAAERAESIRIAAARIKVEHEGQRYPMVTFSLGVSTFPRRGLEHDPLVRAADT